MRRCPACQWLNLERSFPSRWTLNPQLRGFIDNPQLRGPHFVPSKVVARLPDAADTDSTVRVLTAARRDVAAELYAIVERHRRHLGQILHTSLNDLSEHEGYAEDAILSFQQWLFPYLLAHGPLPFFDGRFDEDLTIESLGWWLRGGQLGATLRTVSTLLTLALEGNELRISNNEVITGRRDRESVWVWEVNANIGSPSLAHEVDLEPTIGEIERSVFGTSVSDLYETLTNIERLRSLTRVEEGPNGSLQIDLSGAPSDLQRKLSVLLLSRDRLRNDTPTFYFPEDVGLRSDAEVIEEAGLGIDWLRYAPLIPTSYGHDGHVFQSCTTSRLLLDRMMQRATSSRNFRLRCAQDVAKARYPGLVSDVAKRTRRYHALLEEAVANICRSVDLTAVSGVETWAGMSRQAFLRECGEIDVLAVGPALGGHAAVAYVVEAKDTDVSFYKGPGAGVARAAVQHGSEQIKRKSDWVCRHLEGLAEAVSEEIPWDVRYVVPIVVTRHTAMPLGAGEAPVVSRYELGPVLRSLQSEPIDSWRRDIRDTVLTAAT